MEYNQTAVTTLWPITSSKVMILSTAFSTSPIESPKESTAAESQRTTFSLVPTIRASSVQTTQLYSTTSSATAPTVAPKETKTFQLTMTITNRFYNNSLADQESDFFRKFAEEVETFIDDALKDISGYLRCRVNRVDEGNGVLCRFTVLVEATSSATIGTIREDLETHKGDLTVEDVREVDAKTLIVFEIQATISNDEFTQELANQSSQKFEKLAKKLEELLFKAVKSEIPDILYVMVIGFRKGSIICIFNIVTKESSTATEADIRETLTTASNEGKLGDYSLKDITVETKEPRDESRVENEPTEFPVWAITLLAALVAMVPIAALIYLAYRVRRQTARKAVITSNVILRAYENIPLEDKHWTE